MNHLLKYHQPGLDVPCHNQKCIIQIIHRWLLLNNPLFNISRTMSIIHVKWIQCVCQLFQNQFNIGNLRKKLNPSDCITNGNCQFLRIPIHFRLLSQGGSHLWYCNRRRSSYRISSLSKKCQTLELGSDDPIVLICFSHLRIRSVLRMRTDFLSICRINH